MSFPKLQSASWLWVINLWPELIKLWTHIFFLLKCHQTGSVGHMSPGEQILKRRNAFLLVNACLFNLFVCVILALLLLILLHQQVCFYLYLRKCTHFSALPVTVYSCIFAHAGHTQQLSHLFADILATYTNIHCNIITSVHKLPSFFDF